MKMRKRRRLIAMSVAAPLSLALWGGGMFKLYTILDGEVRQVAARVERAIGDGLRPEQDQAVFVARVTKATEPSLDIAGGTEPTATAEDCPLQIVRIQVRQASAPARQDTAPKASVKATKTRTPKASASEPKPAVPAVQPAPTAPSVEIEATPEAPKAPDPRMMIALNQGGVRDMPKVMVINSSEFKPGKMAYAATKMTAAHFDEAFTRIKHEEINKAIEEAMKQIKQCPDLNDPVKFETALRGISTRFIEGNRYEFHIGTQSE
jgi:hypothetical protein